MTRIRVDGYLEVDPIDSDADRRRILRHATAYINTVARSLSTDDERRTMLVEARKTVERVIKTFEKRGKHAHCFFCDHLAGYQGRELVRLYIPVYTMEGQEVKHVIADVCSYCQEHGARLLLDGTDIDMYVPQGA